MLLRTLFCISVALLAATGCEPNESGKVRATEVGSHSDVPATRARYDQLVHDSCGTDAPLESSPALPRAPYLQKLGAESGSLLWTANVPRSHVVDVSLP